MYQRERSPNVDLVDITGGAPELNAGFRDLVAGARGLGRRVIDRCNLTVIFEPGMAGLPEYLAANAVELVCSLPCYGEDNVDRQRGAGVFDKSIQALRLLNDLGYGRAGSGLSLMPEGLEAAISVEQMADLIAFLLASP